jgi:hypothetical protein
LGRLMTQFTIARLKALSPGQRLVYYRGNLEQDIRYGADSPAYRENLINWEFPRLRRATCKSLTFPVVEPPGPSSKLRIVSRRAQTGTYQSYSRRSGKLRRLLSGR